MNKKTGIFIAIVIVLGVAYFFSSRGKESIALPQAEEEVLRATVFERVDILTDGLWGEELTIDEVHESKAAVKGTWVAYDRWDWIAWKEGDSEWAILVSMDGFDCVELNAIPARFIEFFSDITTAPSGGRYCYEYDEE